MLALKRGDALVKSGNLTKVKCKSWIIIAKTKPKLARIGKKPTIQSREIQTAVRLLLPGELAKHAVAEGTKAVAKYTSTR